MVYKKFKNLDLSALGFGAMRLPVVSGDDAKIDEAAVQEMVDCAMAKGINYYDTAWGYHGGNSESVMGRALGRHPRESFFLATKFPGYDVSNMSRADEIFERQLKNCGVDFFDFYLFHNVCEANIDLYLDEKYGVYEYLMKQKKAGRIRHLGFSIHGSLEVTKRFLNAYGEGIEFCQVQLNYIDWTLQNARAKVELLRENKIPIWVMEPLRGGKLARLSPEHAARLKVLRPDEEALAWAFRFLQSLEGVAVTLSGMSDLRQLQENIRIFEDEKPLNEGEFAAALEVADSMIKKTGLPCTACRYCLPYCKQGLDIPMLLELYNEHSFTENGFRAPMVIESLPAEKRPKACAGCGTCEEVCPQQIRISDAMADFTFKLEAAPDDKQGL